MQCLHNNYDDNIDVHKYLAIELSLLCTLNLTVFIFSIIVFGKGERVPVLTT